MNMWGSLGLMHCKAVEGKHRHVKLMLRLSPCNQWRQGTVGFAQVLVLDWITWNLRAHNRHKQPRKSRYRASRTKPACALYKQYRE